MDTNYCFIGVKRSGNHALINWLIPQMSNVVRFYNDQQYFSNKKEEREDWVRYSLRLDYCRVYVDTKQMVNENIGTPIDVSKQMVGEMFGDYFGDNIISFEDTNLSKILSNEDKWISDFDSEVRKMNENLKITNNNKYILLMRNPWNIMAAHVKWKIRIPLYKRKYDFFNVWNEMYQHYIEKKLPNVHVVIFDKWFSDIEYRKEISKQLGLQFSDQNLNVVPRIARGSTFDKLDFDGKAQKMNVLNRYKQINGNEQMNYFVNTVEGDDLKNKWNHICDLENIENLKIV